MKDDKKDIKTGKTHYTHSELLKCIGIVGTELRTHKPIVKSQETTSREAKVSIANCESAIINHTICKLYKWVFLHFGVKLSVFFKRVEEQMEKQKQLNSNTI